MSDLTPVREAVETLAAGSSSPDFGELQRRAARRGRRRIAVGAVTGVMAVVTGGVALAFGTSSDGDRPAPVGEPTTSSSEPPPGVEATPLAECSFGFARCADAFGRELDAILLQVPGWAPGAKVPDGSRVDLVIEGPCEGTWDEGAGASHGSSGSATGLYHAQWPSEAEAVAGAALLVDNLVSCDETAWSTQPIARPGAVLASSGHAVIWIQQTRGDVWILQVLSDDGPPPPDVQLAVAKWMDDYAAWQRMS